MSLLLTTVKLYINIYSLVWVGLEFIIQSRQLGKLFSAVNGQWSEGIPVNQTNICGDVTITWERKCNNPSPSNGGLYCRGEAVYTTEETLAPCSSKCLNSGCFLF